MRTTTQSRIKESAFELNFSGEPNTERSTMLKLKKNFFTAKMEKLQSLERAVAPTIQRNQKNRKQ